MIYIVDGSQVLYWYQAFLQACNYCVQAGKGVNNSNKLRGIVTEDLNKS